MFNKQTWLSFWGNALFFRMVGKYIVANIDNDYPASYSECVTLITLICFSCLDRKSTRRSRRSWPDTHLCWRIFLVDLLATSGGEFFLIAEKIIWDTRKRKTNPLPACSEVPFFALSLQVVVLPYLSIFHFAVIVVQINRICRSCFHSHRQRLIIARTLLARKFEAAVELPGHVGHWHHISMFWEGDK